MKTSRRRSAVAKALLACLLSIAGVLAQETALASQIESENKHAVAVIIGNQTYQHQDVPRVDFAHNDADAIKRFVIDILGYREGNIIDLRDATQAQLTSTFGNRGNHKGKLWSWMRKGQSDVTVFYSGHGVPGVQDGRGYLLPVDADPETADLNGYPVDLLYENLAKLPALSVTVYLDACFSGQTPKGTLVRAASGIMVEPRLPMTAKGLTVLTAARGDQMASWDEKAKHGLFTRYLLEALHGAADRDGFGDGDGTVSLGEAQRYLDEEMTYAAKRHYRRVQTATALGDAMVTLAAVAAGVPSALAVPMTPPESPSFDVTSLDQTMVVSGASLLRVREVPGGAQVGALSSGVEVEVTGETHHEGKRWYRVALVGGVKGFVHGDYLGNPSAATKVEKAVGVFVKPTPPPAPVRPEYPVGKVLSDCDTCPEMVVVPSGSYRMGSLESEKGRDDDEGPVHRVTIPAPFAVGRFEVTVGQYRRFAEATGRGSGDGCYIYEGGVWKEDARRNWRDPGFDQDDNHPVVCVNWDDAKGFVAWLSEDTGKAYRLLSESEWEYIARARTTTRRYWGDDLDEGAVCGKANGAGGETAFDWRNTACADGYPHTAPVGQFGGNAWKVHDTIGNVWEWVEDCWVNDYEGAPADGSVRTTGDCTNRVLRGGSWFNLPRVLRSADRYWNWSGVRSSIVGFRVARTLTR